jgi:hypothetical protein
LIGKVAALPGFNRPDRAVATIEENALAVRLVHEREAVARRLQAGESLDEVKFAEPEAGGDFGDLNGVDVDKAGLPTAAGAALALIINRSVTCH